METKKCHDCKRILPLSEFNKNSSRKDGLSNKCRGCNRRYQKEWYQKNKTLHKERSNMRRKSLGHRIRLNKYGLTQAEYDAIYERQNGKCAICQGDEDLVIDHCHESNEVRGILCRNCNSGIGMLGDSVENLSGAIEYLQK